MNAYDHSEISPSACPTTNSRREWLSASSIIAAAVCNAGWLATVAAPRVALVAAAAAATHTPSKLNTETPPARTTTLQPSLGEKRTVTTGLMRWSSRGRAGGGSIGWGRSEVLLGKGFAAACVLLAGGTTTTPAVGSSSSGAIASPAAAPSALPDEEPAAAKEGPPAGADGAVNAVVDDNGGIGAPPAAIGANVLASSRCMKHGRWRSSRQTTGASSGLDVNDTARFVLTLVAKPRTALWWATSDVPNCNSPVSGSKMRQ